LSITATKVAKAYYSVYITVASSTQRSGDEKMSFSHESTTRETDDRRRLFFRLPLVSRLS